MVLALALLAQPTDGGDAPIVEAPVTEPAADLPLKATNDTPSDAGIEATLLLADQAFSETIVREGPLAAYTATISADGILYDAAGPSKRGQVGAAERFASFPADATLQRLPEGARADGTIGTTWGSYAFVQKGAQLVTGRYITSWQRESNGRWTLLVELAAGRAAPQPPAPEAEPMPSTEPPAPVQVPGSQPRVLRDAFGRPVQPVEAPAPEAAPDPQQATPIGQPEPDPAPPQLEQQPATPPETLDSPDLSNPSSPR